METALVIWQSQCVLAVRWCECLPKMKKNLKYKLNVTMNNSREQAGEITNASRERTKSRAEILLTFNANQKRILRNWKQWNVARSLVLCVQPDYSVFYCCVCEGRAHLSHLGNGTWLGKVLFQVSMQITRIYL